MKRQTSIRMYALVALSLLTAACGAPPDPLTVPAHIALVEQRVQASNRRDFAAWQALHLPDAVRSAPELEQPLTSSAAMRAAIEELLVAFPDYSLQIMNAFGEGDWLLVQMRAMGRQTGPLLLGTTRVPPTGKSFVNDSTFVFRFRGDKIAEVHEYYDQLGIALQLGILSLP